MEKRLTPDENRLARLQSLPADAPVAALNLFRFRAQAEYAPGDPEFGTDAANITGREAWARYAAVAEPTIVALGSRVVFSAPVDQVMIGPADCEWDVAAIMFFPTRRAFMEMTGDPEFQAASRHRKAALDDHTMLHLVGDPFVSPTAGE